ncbi:secreted frizzled-related protein 2-like [Tigriopus californicus]|uniref:secreted frizzled-related protein 2-like n=1 Tax=Tigriopus californicus TaxID=6832 RepID=UPI0027D9F70A|nr:secreted frizzled-related protein 2-like [Tigriopus californicus]
MTGCGRVWVGLFLSLTWLELTHAFFANFSPVIPMRAPEVVNCHAIPSNMTLCQAIGYPKMKLPNLLGHETMTEAIDQSNSWLALDNINCHASSRLFLCSLFAPVCLETPISIYPCRSLCESVRQGCEKVMQQHGFPWPTILACDKFPEDNDMCITDHTQSRSASQPVAPTSVSSHSGSRPRQPSRNDNEVCESQVCAPLGRRNVNVLDLYCQSDFVIKMKTKRMKRNLVLGKRVKHVYKTWRGTPEEMKLLRKPVLKLPSSDDCCQKKIDKNKIYLVMGNYRNNSLVVSYIHRWSKSKTFRKLRRKFKRMSCN